MALTIKCDYDTMGVAPYYGLTVPNPNYINPDLVPKGKVIKINGSNYTPGQYYPNYPLSYQGTTSVKEIINRPEVTNLTIILNNIPSPDPILQAYKSVAMPKSNGGRRRRRRNSKFSRNVSKKMKGLRSLFNTRKWTLKRKSR